MRLNQASIRTPRVASAASKIKWHLVNLYLQRGREHKHKPIGVSLDFNIRQLAEQATCTNGSSQMCHNVIGLIVLFTVIKHHKPDYNHALPAANLKQVI